ncbi:MAG: type IV pilus modification PilV family protein, partial [Planctomycetia bacterium]
MNVNGKWFGRSARGSSSGRAGGTLVEVLVAIVVFTVGVLGVLSLFPVGVARVRQAVIDTRVTMLYQNAKATNELFDLPNRMPEPVATPPTGYTALVDSDRAPPNISGTEDGPDHVNIWSVHRGSAGSSANFRHRLPGFNQEIDVNSPAHDPNLILSENGAPLLPIPSFPVLIDPALFTNGVGLNRVPQGAGF